MAVECWPAQRAGWPLHWLSALALCAFLLWSACLVVLAGAASGRRWIGVECERDYAIASAFRFMAEWPLDRVQAFVDAARSGKNELEILDVQKSLF